MMFRYKLVFANKDYKCIDCGCAIPKRSLYVDAVEGGFRVSYCLRCAKPITAVMLKEDSRELIGVGLYPNGKPLTPYMKMLITSSQ